MTASPQRKPPAYVQTILDDPAWQRQKAELDARSAKLDDVVRFLRKDMRWAKLNLPPEAEADDIVIAFQVEWGDFVIRAELVDECGNASRWWKKGNEAECLEKWEFFHHGTPVEASASELQEHDWIMDSAVLSFVMDHDWIKVTEIAPTPSERAGQPAA